MMRWLFVAALFAMLFVCRSHAQVQPGFQSAVLTSPVTYYVCAKANGGTCVYNGDAGTVAPTISDNNDCLKKSSPCATINGVATLVNNKIINTVVTIQLATTAGTGTDCYRPNNTKFQLATSSANVDAALELGEQFLTTGTYPSAYLYLVGDTTTPSNVIVTGATTCAGTTANDAFGIRFSNGMFRVRGIKAQYFQNVLSGGLVEGGAFVFYDAKANVEDLYCTGDTTTTGILITGYRSTLRLGSGIQWLVTACNVVDSLNQSHTSFFSPLGQANISITVSTGWVPLNAIISSNENSHMAVDGVTLAVSGAGTATLWDAFDHSSLYWTDSTTGTWSETVNGANITYMAAADGSYIHNGCRTSGNQTCNIGNTTAISTFASATRNSFIDFVSLPTGATTTLSATHNSFISAPFAAAPFSLFAPTATTFANLPPNPTNGWQVYCSNCTIANPCAGTGTGAFAKRLNGVWVCN